MDDGRGSVASADVRALASTQSPRSLEEDFKLRMRPHTLRTCSARFALCFTSTSACEDGCSTTAAGFCGTLLRLKADTVPLSEAQRQRVLDAMSEGRLPLDAPKNMYAGYGTRRICMGCGETIYPTEVEYEAEYGDGRTYLFHLGCAGIWDAERRRRSATEDAKTVQDQSEAARAQAQMNAKESAQLRDQADVLAREAEAVREKSKQVKRGRHNVDGQ